MCIRVLSFLSLLPLGMLVAQPNFQDKSLQVGLQGTTGPNHGINVADYDGDGYEDFFVGRQGASNWLFRNNGDGTFSEVATTAGVAGQPAGQTYAACWGDLDNDGDQDLYVGDREAPDQLYENQGDGTFREVSVAAKITNVGAPRSINLADVDNDGLLDIYVSNFRLENVLYRNLGGLRFSDQTQERTAGDTGISMGSIFVDYDLDGDPDLYLTHDNRQPNILLQNDGRGYFTDVSSSSSTNLGGFGMGVDAGDVNNDGWPDLYVTNLHDNFLFLNQGDGTFSEQGVPGGTNDYGMGWGTMFLDYDNDGWEDIYVVNNSYFSPYANVLYKNLQQDTFANVTNLNVEGSPYGGYSAASTDLNQDGKLDILLTNTGQTGGLQYFENSATNDHHWLAIQLEGSISNRDAVGAIVTVKSDRLTLVQQVIAGSGYASQNSSKLHFGLGADSLIHQLTIRWPSGETETLTDLSGDQLLTIKEGEGLLNSNRNLRSLPRFQLYPNPAGDRIQISLGSPVSPPTLIKITNSVGQVYHQVAIGRSGTLESIAIETGHFPSGTYLVHISGYATQKLVVTN